MPIRLSREKKQHSLENLGLFEIQTPDIDIHYGAPAAAELKKSKEQTPVKEQAHPRYQILIFPEHEGEARLSWRTAGGKLAEQKIQGRQICTIGKRVAHMLHWTQKTAFARLLVSEDFIKRNGGAALSGVTIKPAWAYDREKTGLHGFADYLAELCGETEPQPHDYVHGLGLALATRILKASRNPSTAKKGPVGLDAALMAKLDACIKANLQGDTSVPALARIACMGKDQFTRRFKRANGKTPHEYVFTIKEQYARSLIAKGGMYMSEIAAEAGFYDQSHMSRHLRQTRGKKR